MKLNNLISRFALAAGMALTCAGLQAESLPVHVTIPFAFTAGGKVMSAGEYSITPLPGFASAVALHHMAGGPNAILLAMMDAPADKTSTVTFSTEGGDKALMGVKTPTWGATFPLTPAPAKVAARAEVPGVAAALRAR